MKKLFIKSFVLLAFVLPAQAQTDFPVLYYSPVIEAKIPGDQVPDEVLSSLSLQFDRNNPVTWSKFPFSMAEYGWVYDMGEENNNLNHFEVTMKTNKQDDYWAMYSNRGELLESQEISRNRSVPAHVRDEFAKSKYNDWKIVESKEIVRFSHDHAFNESSVKHQFRLTVEKDGEQKSLTYNWKASLKQFDYSTYKEADRLKYNMLVSK